MERRGVIHGVAKSPLPRFLIHGEAGALVRCQAAWLAGALVFSPANNGHLETAFSAREGF